MVVSCCVWLCFMEMIPLLFIIWLYFYADGRFLRLYFYVDDCVIMCGWLWFYTHDCVMLYVFLSSELVNLCDILKNLSNDFEEFTPDEISFFS